MPRVKLSDLSAYPYQIELGVRVTDINYGGHLGYDRLLGLAHEARIHLLEQLGASELDLGDGRTGVVAVDLQVLYQGLAFRGDRLRFEIGIAELRSTSFRLAHRVRRASDGGEIARLEICLAAYDAAAQRPTVLPEAFRARVEALARGA